MRKSVKALFAAAFLVFALVFSSACSAGRAKKPVQIKTLIIPKFEVGEMSGDYAGEAQLFYEAYCPDANETVLSNLPETAHFFVNEENGVALLVTGSGKAACALALTAVLSDPAFDFSKAYLVSVGCAGGSAGLCTLGDVVLVTGACDNELGHTADISEFDNQDADTNWFYDSSYDATSAKRFSSSLTDLVWALISEYQPATTEVSQKVLAANFPAEEWALRSPKVMKGTALSGDSYWKGETGHNNALKIIGQYRMTDPYAVTEMEELTVALTADCYGLLDRVISLRVVVDLDVFLGDDSPESLWTASEGYNNDPEGCGSAALDIFEPAMQSLFEVSKIVIDAVLDGRISTEQ